MSKHTKPTNRSKDLWVALALVVKAIDSGYRLNHMSPEIHHAKKVLRKYDFQNRSSN